jgi:hypothetical protein
MYSQPGLTEKEVQKLKKLEEKMKRMEYALYLNYHTINKAMANTQKKLKIREKKTAEALCVVPKEQLKQPTDDVCPVCYETHTFADVIKTSCGHKIGKNCYQLWTNRCTEVHTPLTCPVCRRRNPQSYRFRYKKTQNPPIAPLPLEETQKP